MAMLAMAVPIPAGKTEQWKKFVSELTGARKAEFAESRRSLGVRERTFLQHPPRAIWSWSYSKAIIRRRRSRSSASARIHLRCGSNSR